MAVEEYRWVCVQPSLGVGIFLTSAGLMIFLEAFLKFKKNRRPIGTPILACFMIAAPLLPVPHEILVARYLPLASFACLAVSVLKIGPQKDAMQRILPFITLVPLSVNILRILNAPGGASMLQLDKVEVTVWGHGRRQAFTSAQFDASTVALQSDNFPETDLYEDQSGRLITGQQVFSRIDAWQERHSVHPTSGRQLGGPPGRVN